MSINRGHICRETSALVDICVRISTICKKKVVLFLTGITLYPALYPAQKYMVSIPSQSSSLH